jgi:hypothetical protein
MGDINIRQFLLAYFASFVLIGVGALIAPLVFIGWLGVLVLGLVSVVLIVNVVTD